MKKIRLAVAQRYLRRYTGAQIECAYREGETPERDFTLRFFLGINCGSLSFLRRKRKFF